METKQPHLAQAAVDAALCADPEAVIRQADAAFDGRLTAIADDIRKNREKRPIVLLSGPSGSGKTTTARKLEKMLDGSGVETHTLSMDDYFRPLSAEQLALAAEEKFDLESPARLDIPLLTQQLEGILAGRPTEIPHFDFTANTRTPSGWVLTRKPGELVILEGIHALNADVIALPDDCTARIYVSVRTRVEQNGKALHPALIRLLRRIARDERFRGRPAQETLRMLPSVQRGEERYILPHKPRAAYAVDTFFPYESGVYRHELLDELSALPGGSAEVDVLVDFLSAVAPVDPALIPADALIREFIGN